jgi:hypothetical protein
MCLYYKGSCDQKHVICLQKCTTLIAIVSLLQSWLLEVPTFCPPYHRLFPMCLLLVPVCERVVLRTQCEAPFWPRSRHSRAHQNIGACHVWVDRNVAVLWNRINYLQASSPIARGVAIVFVCYCMVYLNGCVIYHSADILFCCISLHSPFKIRVGDKLLCHKSRKVFDSGITIFNLLRLHKHHI